MTENHAAIDVCYRIGGEPAFSLMAEGGLMMSEAARLRHAVQWATTARRSLASLDLAGADLSGLDLSQQNLADADLSCSDLSGVCLARANLARADLSGCDLSNSDLSWANLAGAELANSNLSSADISGANLSGANLSGVNLSGTVLVRSDLSRADLTRTDLSRAVLSDGELRPFIADLWMTLATVGGPGGARELVRRLKSGEVDGLDYGEGSGPACLIGSVAAMQERPGIALDHDGSRPAEIWFAMINLGDTPETQNGGGFAAGKAVEWIQSWLSGR